jgi:hypothetical protein
LCVSVSNSLLGYTWDRAVKRTAKFTAPKLLFCTTRHSNFSYFDKYYSRIYSQSPHTPQALDFLLCVGRNVAESYERRLPNTLSFFSIRRLRPTFSLRQRPHSRDGWEDFKCDASANAAVIFPLAASWQQQPE